MVNGLIDDSWLEAAKKTLRITSSDFDDEIKDIIRAAAQDLSIAGITSITADEPVIKRAILTYCRLNFGEPADPARLKASYDEQKAQLKVSSRFRNWRT